MGAVSLSLSCQGTSTDMQLIDLTLLGHHVDAPLQREHDGARIMPLAFKVRKLFAQKNPTKTNLTFLTSSA